MDIGCSHSLHSGTTVPIARRQNTQSLLNDLSMSYQSVQLIVNNKLHSNDYLYWNHYAHVHVCVGMGTGRGTMRDRGEEEGDGEKRLMQSVPWTVNKSVTNTIIRLIIRMDVGQSYLT